MTVKPLPLVACVPGLVTVQLKVLSPRQAEALAVDLGWCCLATQHQDGSQWACRQRCCRTWR